MENYKEKKKFSKYLSRVLNLLCSLFPLKYVFIIFKKRNNFNISWTLSRFYLCLAYIFLNFSHGEEAKGGSRWLRDAFIISTFLVWPHRFLTIASCVCCVCVFVSFFKFSVIVSVIVRVLFPFRFCSHQEIAWVRVHALKRVGWGWGMEWIKSNEVYLILGCLLRSSKLKKKIYTYIYI